MSSESKIKLNLEEAQDIAIGFAKTLDGRKDLDCIAGVGIFMRALILEALRDKKGPLLVFSHGVLSELTDELEKINDEIFEDWGCEPIKEEE